MQVNLMDKYKQKNYKVNTDPQDKQSLLKSKIERCKINIPLVIE